MYHVSYSLQKQNSVFFCQIIHAFDESAISQHIYVHVHVATRYVKGKVRQVHNTTQDLTLRDVCQCLLQQN